MIYVHVGVVKSIRSVAWGKIDIKSIHDKPKASQHGERNFMRKGKLNLSIKNIILLIFIIALFIAVILFGTLIFTNWTTSAKTGAVRIADDVNEDIYNRVLAFIEEPYNNNEVNHKIIENGMLDLADEKQRDQFFVDVLESQTNEIYSFSYGTSAGEYYGARRNQDNVIEIMRNNEDTGGNSWYYSVNEDRTAGDLVVRAGQFDPRTRAWYKAALATEGAIFSPLYKHFVMNDLTVSAAWPIYNDSGGLDGVLGTHLLLSDIGTYLSDIVDEYQGTAIIFEKESRALVANSFGMPDFTVLEDGTLKRYEIADVDKPVIQNVFKHYKEDNQLEQIVKGEDGNFFINMKEIQMAGIDWVIMSAIPESLFMTDVIKTMVWAGFLAILFLIGSILIYRLVMQKYLKPMKTLLQVSGELAAGDLSKRVPIVRDDEIGLISESFNNVADKIQVLINHLDTTVQKRTRELEIANRALKESKEEFRLILDSAVEGIYGIDLKGKCTFCNISCIKTLGYHDQTDLLGENMHWKIHHTRPDGTAFPAEECKILNTFIKGQGSHVEDEVLWRADGTFFYAEYFSYPQIKNGKIIGAVITFNDISQRKQTEAEIKYLACYDPLTGLQNRRCFEENSVKIDKVDNLPLAVIFADINGLKMTNDIFGHLAGDELIKKSAEILKRSLREEDLIARIGGDEFVILLPQTTRENAEKMLTRIKSEFMDTRVKAIKCSISLGLDSKQHANEILADIIANAENAMYKEKVLKRNTINQDMIETIIETLHLRSPKEKQHSIAVSKLARELGLALQLRETEISKLARAAYLHNIGKIVVDDDLLNKEILSDEEFEKMQDHPTVGYRILNLFDETVGLAEYVYAYQERWDGSGYPRQLKGQQIPLLSRIIALVEGYNQMLNNGGFSLKEGKEAALQFIKDGAGQQFDPQIVTTFVELLAK